MFGWLRGFFRFFMFWQSSQPPVDTVAQNREKNKTLIREEMAKNQLQTAMWKADQRLAESRARRSKRESKTPSQPVKADDVADAGETTEEFIQRMHNTTNYFAVPMEVDIPKSAVPDVV